MIDLKRNLMLVVTTRSFGIAARERASLAVPILSTSDAALAASTRVALTAADSALHAVAVVVTRGRVFLKGSIPSYYLKQVAQEAVRRVSGSAGFANLLVVGESARQKKSKPDIEGTIW